MDYDWNSFCLSLRKASKGFRLFSNNLGVLNVVSFSLMSFWDWSTRMTWYIRTAVICISDFLTQCEYLLGEDCNYVSVRHQSLVKCLACIGFSRYWLRWTDSSRGLDIGCELNWSLTQLKMKLKLKVKMDVVSERGIYYNRAGKRFFLFFSQIWKVLFNCVDAHGYHGIGLYHCVYLQLQWFWLLLTTA